MRTIYLLFTIGILLGCKPKTEHKKIAQVVSPIFYTENPTYTKNFRDLLRDFQLFQKGSSKLILLDKPIEFKDIGNFLKDSASCTPFEINYIKEETKYLSLIRFDYNLGEIASIGKTEEIYSLFTPRNATGWRTLHKKYGTSFVQFAHPVFFRDNSCCILYLNYTCGSRCGQEQIRFYKKENNKWILIRTGYG